MLNIYDFKSNLIIIMLQSVAWLENKIIMFSPNNLYENLCKKN